MFKLFKSRKPGPEPPPPEPSEVAPPPAPMKDHYLARLFPDKDCRICYGGTPIHRHYRGVTKRDESVCPTARVEILAFMKGEK